MDESELTLCSSTYFDKKFLELNWKLTKALNPDMRYLWNVIDNNPPGSEEYMTLSLPGLHVYKGNYFDTTRKRADSYHHGNALNKAIRLVKTRFALIIDPDFYILRKNWIIEIIEYMKTENLAIFGAPWNPKWFTKYRYFPCVHCMFIDLKNAKLDTLDFRPGQNDYALKHDSSVLSKIIKRIRNRIINDLYLRRIIIKAQDTGYDVYHRYFGMRGFKSEIVIPVYKNIIGRSLNHFLNTILPDRFSFIPKRLGSYSRFGFRELGYTDVEKYGWEEFIWKNEPFGFHLRRFFRRHQQSAFEAEDEIINLNRMVFNLAGLETSFKI